MRVTYLVSKELPPVGSRRGGTDPKFPDGGGARRDGSIMPRSSSAPPQSTEASGQGQPGSVSGAGPPGTARLMRGAGLSSPDPRHPRFTAISWVVLQEVRHDAAMALLRLELLRRQHPEGAIARATEFLRCAVGELDALATGESDADGADSGGPSAPGPAARG